MNVLSEFLIIALSAAVLQNAVFTRGLGSSKDTRMLGAPRRIFAFGAALTFITVVSAALAWPLNRLLREQQLSTRLGIRYLTSISTLACVCVVFTLLYLVTRAWFPRIHYPLRRDAANAAFSCAVLGTILIAFSGGYGFVKTVGFAFGSGIGYTAALLLVREGRRRIALSDVPRAFRGLPIMLLYIGILSLAIYGLIGHQLPT